MSSYSFEHIIHSKPDFATGKIYIWVWNADKVPPHLGLSIEKEYLSLTYKALERKSVSGMLGKANRLKIPLLFVEIPSETESDIILEKFAQYKRAVSGVSTCLSPIKDVFGLHKNIEQLAHLLKAMEQEQIGFKVFALHLDSSYHALPYYTIATINERIQALTHADK